MVGGLGARCSRWIVTIQCFELWIDQNKTHEFSHIKISSDFARSQITKSLLFLLGLSSIYDFRAH